MTALTVIRHAQASFGAANYDLLSDLGHRQSRALGQALVRQGVKPDHLFIGAQRRHRETLEGICEALGFDAGTAHVHEGLNEFDFKGLLEARFREGGAPEGMHSDRRTHFRTLRDTVLAWQRDEITDPPESWEAFAARVRAARESMQKAGGAVLAVSSGGAIAQMITEVIDAPSPQMIRLQLQMKNCAVTRFIAGREVLYLHCFNETPHIDAATEADLLTYS
ncbi:MAG: histidine phosphatase family protein [Rhodobacteraceae bacterium]|nr:histidine phosphatase family protein [Paracoccaceae bacterium]